MDDTPIIMFVNLAPNVNVMCVDTPTNHELIPDWKRAWETKDYDKLIEYFPYINVRDLKTNTWM
jgi:hypothetical protein